MENLACNASNSLFSSCCWGQKGGHRSQQLSGMLNVAIFKLNIWLILVTRFLWLSHPVCFSSCHVWHVHFFILFVVLCLKATCSTTGTPPALQRFLTESALSLPPQVSDMAIVLVVTTYMGFATGISFVQGNDAAKYPTAYRTNSQKSYLAPMSILLKLGNPGLKAGSMSRLSLFSFKIDAQKCTKHFDLHSIDSNLILQPIGESI